ncbi:hypothetical protein [Arenimonas daejeonensis]|uniref:hypothetical protein n=1 Tax=Arenimonas daejeonensis TaxID=370777 RepID=UPI0011BFA815|nr:hypothetical protein [Arenimonas daejeonensis]
MKLVIALLFTLSLSGCGVFNYDGYGTKAGGDTVLVCHKGKRTMEVPSSAADAHLSHGDSYGNC